MALNYRLLDGSEADGNAVNKRRWLQPKVAGVVALLGLVCILGLLTMPEAVQPQAKAHVAPAFLGQVAETSAVSIVESMLGAWEAGAYSGTDALANVHKTLSSDFFLDASGPKIPGFKLYEGPEAILDWLAFFSKTFTVKAINGNVTAGAAPGQAFWAWSLDVAVPSGKACSLKGVDDFRVNSAGLVSSITIYWDVEKVNECLAGSSRAAIAMSVVKRTIEAWEAGAWVGPQAMETAEKFSTEDVFLDSSGPNHPAFKLYKGRQAVLDWVAAFSKVANITAVSGTFFPGATADKVLWAWSLTLSTPKGQLFPSDALEEFTVSEEGKISGVIAYWDVKTINEYLAAI